MNIKLSEKRSRHFSLKRVFSMNATMFLLNLAYLGHRSIEAVEYVSEGRCSPIQQRQILHNVTGCSTRDTLIDLKEHMPNTTNVFQVIPDFATVQRCGGSCDQYNHRCIPTETSTKRLDVMVILSQLPRTQTETQCGFVEVEEHLGCKCDCPIQAHHCRADQYYEESSCQCLCRDQGRRTQCIMQGMQWGKLS